MQTDRKIPITRNNLFFGEKTFNFFENMGKEYVEQVLNQTVVLYQIDRILTNTDDLYGETKTNEIRYQTPIELNCRYNIDQSQNKAYINTNNTARYRQVGNIKVHIYDKTLKEMECDIKFGDIIGVPIKEDTFIFFEVLDDGKRNWSNKETMWGYKPLWRTIIACELDPVVFNG